jgi:hypothetical protein
MADQDKPSLHIDTDWKKQAQEEKRKLVEQEQQRAASPTWSGSVAAPAAPTAPASAAGAATSATAGAAAAAPRPAARGGGQAARALPPASLATLVQALVTQALFYLGDLATRGGEPVLDLDMAKHQIDTLTMLEQKTKGNLSDDEQRLLDAALYEVRMRYVAVARQYIP